MKKAEESLQDLKGNLKPLSPVEQLEKLYNKTAEVKVETLVQPTDGSGFMKLTSLINDMDKAIDSRKLKVDGVYSEATFLYFPADLTEKLGKLKLTEVGQKIATDLHAQTDELHQYLKEKNITKIGDQGLKKAEKGKEPQNLSEEEIKVIKELSQKIQENTNKLVKDEHVIDERTDDLKGLKDFKTSLTQVEEYISGKFPVFHKNLVETHIMKGLTSQGEKLIEELNKQESTLEQYLASKNITTTDQGFKKKIDGSQDLVEVPKTELEEIKQLFANFKNSANQLTEEHFRHSNLDNFDNFKTRSAQLTNYLDNDNTLLSWPEIKNVYKDIENAPEKFFNESKNTKISVEFDGSSLNKQLESQAFKYDIFLPATYALNPDRIEKNLSAKYETMLKTANESYKKVGNFVEDLTKDIDKFANEFKAENNRRYQDNIENLDKLQKRVNKYKKKATKYIPELEEKIAHIDTQLKSETDQPNRKSLIEEKTKIEKNIDLAKKWIPKWEDRLKQYQEYEKQNGLNKPKSSGEEKTVVKLEKKIEKKALKVATITEELTLRKKELAAMDKESNKDKIKTLETKIEKIEKKLKRREDELVELKAQKDNPQPKNEEKSADKLEKKIKAKESKVEQTQIKLERRKKRLETMMNDPKADQEKVAALKKKIEKTEDKLNRREHKLKILENKRTKLKSTAPASQETKAAPSSGTSWTKGVIPTSEEAKKARDDNVKLQWDKAAEKNARKLNQPVPPPPPKVENSIDPKLKEMPDDTKTPKKEEPITKTQEKPKEEETKPKENAVGEETKSQETPKEKEKEASILPSLENQALIVGALMVASLFFPALWPVAFIAAGGFVAADTVKAGVAVASGVKSGIESVSNYFSKDKEPEVTKEIAKTTNPSKEEDKLTIKDLKEELKESKSPAPELQKELEKQAENLKGHQPKDVTNLSHEHPKGHHHTSHVENLRRTKSQPNLPVTHEEKDVHKGITKSKSQLDLLQKQEKAAKEQDHTH